jgi:hypothetical protein
MRDDLFSRERLQICTIGLNLKLDEEGVLRKRVENYTYLSSVAGNAGYCRLWFEM